MEQDINVAFDQLDARVKADAGPSPLDRIAVRDYTKSVEIGAFQSERGVKQSIRFNVILEVKSSAAATFDDVDQVLSYDTITEAIETQLHFERLNLLETLAERIASQILSHAQAVRCYVRIEKLDRIPGTLGIEIVRSKGEASSISPVKNTEEPEANVIPMVLFLPNRTMNDKNLRKWLDQIEKHCLPAILCLEESPVPAPVSNIDPANRRIHLLSMEQNAWVLAGQDDRCVVVDSRTELDWAMKQGQLSVWAPSKMVLDAVEKPKVDAKPLDLAQWLAKEFDASLVLSLGSGPYRPNVKVIAKPENLAQL